VQFSAQLDVEIYRVIVFRCNGAELLLNCAQAGLSLPEVRIPLWQRAAENLAVAMKRDWGEEVICLFELSERDLPGMESVIRYQVSQSWGGAGKPAVPTRWISSDELREDSLVDRWDYMAIQRSLAQCRAAVRDPGAGSFARLDWFPELCRWAGGAIASRGLHLNGKLRQLNASSSFSLIRFETNGRAVWFKAVGEPNEREFPITLTLARLLPKHIPEVLAIRTDWHGWLMLDVAGTILGETTDLSLWQTAAAATAKLQIESIAKTAQLLQAGARDLRGPVLGDAVSPFMRVIAELMRRQGKIPPPVLGETEIRLLEERVQGAILQLGEWDVPDTLGHLDLNPGNIIIAPQGCLFLDWAEAYVGHPFLSWQYLREHFLRVVGADPASEAELAAGYLTAWEPVASRDVLAEAMALARLVAVFACAVGIDAWRHRERLEDPRLAGYLRALARRMNREAHHLSNRRAPCQG
jgi:hypothetical protein